jgi:hypothetical protein
MNVDDLKAWQRIVGAEPDGNPGPRTFAATVQWFRAHGYIAPLATPSDARDAVVREARAGVGKWTEAEVDDLWREVGAPQFVGHWHAISWCGGYALRCLRRALGVDWTWRHSLGFLEVQGLPKTSLPEVGDVAYYARNQHHAVVTAIPGGGMVTVVNGNGLPAPLEGVTETTRPLSEATAYYSIGRLA